MECMKAETYSGQNMSAQIYIMHKEKCVFRFIVQLKFVF